MNIVFDATRLIYPNTGLYHFTLELSNALEHQSKLSDVAIEFLYRGNKAILPYNGRKVRAIDKIISRNPSNAKVWHSPYQLYRYKAPRSIAQLVTVHDLNFLREKKTAKQAEYLRKLQKEIDRADSIVAISEFTRTDIYKHLNLGTKSVEVIYNGCNIPTVAPIKPSTVTEAPFLYGIGTMLAKKNWHTLPAILLNTPYDLILSGAPTAYCEQIINEAKRHGMDKRIHLTGAINEAEKQWYLSSCAGFVFPSLAEGFGLPVIEAMYHGKPLFLSPHCSLPEIAGDMAYYFNPSFDPDQMHQTLISGMAHFAKTGNPQAMKDKSLTFSWDNAAQDYLKLYNQYK